MNKAVDIGGFLIDFEEPLVLEFLLIRSFSSQDHFHRFIVVIELLFDAVKVEVVTDELIVNLTEELMVFEVAEPLNPTAI